MRRRLAWVTAVALALDFAAPAYAESPDAAAPPRVVELVVVGGGDEGVHLIGTVSDLLGGIGLAVEAHAVSSVQEVLRITRGSAAARVQVDLRDPGEALIVAEGKDLAATRRLLHRDPSAAVAREELAQAVESAVQALLLEDRPPGQSPPDAGDAGPGDDVAVRPAESVDAQPPRPLEPTDAATRADSEPPTRAEAAPPAAASALALDISVLAGGGAYGSGAGVVADVGGEVALSWRRGWRPSLLLSGLAVLPFDASADAVTGRATAFSARALAGVDLLYTRWLALTSGAGGGADVLWVEPQSATLAPSVLGVGTTRFDPIVTAFLAARLALVTDVSLTCVISGDLDLDPSRYVVVQGSSADSVLTPWRFRPTFLAGLTFTAFGERFFRSGRGGG